MESRGSYLRTLGIVSAADPLFSGASGDAVLQAFFDYLAEHGGVGFIPPGDYVCTDTVTVSGDGITVFGAGGWKTTISRGAGMTGKPILALVNCRECSFDGLGVVAGGGDVCSAGIEIRGDTGGISTSNVFKNLYVRSTAVPSTMTNNIHFAIGSAGDQNNDLCSLYSCVLSNPVNANVKIEGSQSREHNFHSCRLFSGVYGIESDGYSMSWHGGNVAEHAVADFYFTRPQQVTTITNISSEQSKRFLSTSGASGGDGYISVTGLRFSADLLHDDGEAIIYQHRGAFTLRGSNIGARTDESLCKIRIEPHGSKGCAFITEGNAWGGAGSLAASPYILGLSKGDKISIADQYISSSEVVDTATALGDGDATPSIFSSSFFTTANTTETTITAFDDAWIGKETLIEIGDDNTIVDLSSEHFVADSSVSLDTSSGDVVRVIWDGERHHVTIVRSG